MLTILTGPLTRMGRGFFCLLFLSFLPPLPCTAQECEEDDDSEEGNAENMDSILLCMLRRRVAVDGDIKELSGIS